MKLYFSCINNKNMQRITVFSLLLLTCFCGWAQNYQPFLPGLLHFFSSTTNYSLRIDSAGLAGNDSVFWMNAIAVPAPQSCTTLYHEPHFIPDQEGYFGDRFQRGADGAYRFISRAADTLTFHSLQPTGMPWSFLTGSALTATISQRSVMNVVGVMDSVITIDISDGMQYQLSQHYGLLSGPNLSYYFVGDMLRAANLAQLPKRLDYLELFDWQPGDVYSTSIIVSASGADHFERLVILSRLVGPNGDNISFTMQRYSADVWHPSGGTYVFPTDVVAVDYRRIDFPYLNTATGEVLFLPTEYYHQKPWSSGLNGRQQLSFLISGSQGVWDSCGFVPSLSPPCTQPLEFRLTQGLGITYKTSVHTVTNTSCFLQTYRMDCYEQAGHDTLAPCPNAFLVLHEEVPAPSAELGLMRDSRSGEWVVSWEGVADGPTLWQLYDLQGRLIQTEQVLMGGGGRRVLTLPGSTGMYLLRITAESGAWAQTIKVPLN
jgi:hypothetical protein